jgi:MFS family permease
MANFDYKIFGTLFFSLFVTVTGVGIVVPLLPVYARDLGASGIYIGMIFGAFSLSRTLFLPYFGRLSDRKGRKRIIVPGLFAYGLISLAFAFSSNVPTLILIRFFHGIASAMLMPVIQAYVGDITPAGKEGTVMGIFNMSLFIGLSVGPLIGGVIHDHFGMQVSFGCMGFLAMIGFLLSLGLLPPTGAERAMNKPHSLKSWQTLLVDREIVAMFVFRLSYTVCIGIIWTFLPVLADAEFALSSSAIGVLIMLGVFISGLIHIPMGIVADRVNKRRMVAAGALVVIYSVWSFQRATGFTDLVLAQVLFGIGGGAAMPALMAMAVSKGSSTDSMGSVMAILTVAHSSGMLLGSLLGGVLMDWFDLRWAFPIGAALMLACLAVFYGAAAKPRGAAKASGPGAN